MKYGNLNIYNQERIERLREPVILQIRDENHIAQAWQTAESLAESVGFKRVLIFHIMTCVSELAYNLFFHTNRGGTITLIAVKRNLQIGIEVIAADDGPGIPDLNLAMQDGFSTNGGLGGGLSGVKRLMDDFEIISTVGLGTYVFTRKWQTCR